MSATQPTTNEQRELESELRMMRAQNLLLKQDVHILRIVQVKREQRIASLQEDVALLEQQIEELEKKKEA